AGEVALELIRPARIDLARRIDAFGEPLLTEHVAQPNDLGGFHDPHREMGRDEDDAAIAAEHDIAGHDGCRADPRRRIDTDERGVQAPRRIVVRRVVAAKESGEAFDLFQTVDVPYRAVIHEAVAGVRHDRTAD